MAAQVCSRGIGYNICLHHAGEKLIYECEDCPDELACRVCVTSTHKRHALVEIKHSVKDKLVTITSFIKNTKKQTLPEIVREIQAAIETLQEYQKYYQGEIQEVKKYGKWMVTEVERSTSEKVLQLQALLKESTDALYDHKADLEMIQYELNAATKECQKTVNEVTGVSVHTTEAMVVKRKAKTKLQTIPKVSKSSVHPCKDPRPHLQKAFGEIIDNEGNLKNRRTGKSAGRITATSAVQQFNFFKQPRTLSSHDTSYAAASNCAVSSLDNTIWIFGEDGRLHHIDETGKEKVSFKPDVEIYRICTHPITGEMFGSTWENRTIKKINTCTGMTRDLFTLRMVAHAIGCTTDNHMIVVHGKDKLCLYNSAGDIISTFKHQSKYDHPEVSVCKITNNIALIKYSSVIVLNKKLQVLYEYRRQLSFTCQDKFAPTTATFVDKYLLVGEITTDDILVIEGGKLIHTIHPDELFGIRALCVQKDLSILHVSGYRKLLCMKYMD